jgi:hypothetical protein
MVLARWQGTIVDDAGNVQAGAQVTVRRETSGAPLAVIYSDRNGSTPTANPITADSEGAVAFHVTGGAYRIDATLGSLTKTWRYVAIGLGAESDSPVVDISYGFSTTTADADPGAGTFRFNNSTLASVTTIYIDLLDDLGSDMTTWLDRLDDAGATTDRGQLTIRAIDGSAEFVAKITGSITTASGYRKITVSYLTSSGTFSDALRCTITFAPRGINGTGDVVGPASATDANIALFDTTTGKLLKDSGKSITTVGAGKQTIVVPASALVVQTGAAGPSAGQITATGTMIAYLAFDATTEEFAYINVAMPKGWNEGQVSFQFYWTHPATTTNFGVAWRALQLAFSDGDSLTVGSGFGDITVVDTGGTTSVLFVSAETSLVTIGGSPQENDLVMFRISRNPADAADTMAVDAYLISVKIFLTMNANTDA